MFQLVLVGLARVVCMTNYVPKEKPPPTYDALRTTDPKLQKDYKKMKIQELKYNKYEVKETTTTLESDCICRPGGTSTHAHNNNHAAHTPSKHSQLRECEQSPDISPIHLYSGLENDVKEIRRFIKTLIYKQKTQENLEKIRGEWRAVALVLDRAFFYLYTLSIVVSLATMFPRGT